MIAGIVLLAFLVVPFFIDQSNRTDDDDWAAHNRQMRHKCAFYAFGSQSASCSIGSVSPVVSRSSSGRRS